MRARVLAVVVAVLVGGLAAGACGRGGDGEAADARRALERAGYRGVALTVRTGGGIDVARVDAVAPGSAPASPDDAAGLVWRSLPVRFDRLVVSLQGATTAYGYDELAGRLGPRDPTLDRRRPESARARGRQELLAVVLLGALLAGGGAVAGALLVRRGLRSHTGDDRGQAGGPTSEPEEASPAGISAEAEGEDAMPS